jgi:hypothetical protein
MHLCKVRGNVTQTAVRTESTGPRDTTHTEGCPGTLMLWKRWCGVRRHARAVVPAFTSNGVGEARNHRRRTPQLRFDSTLPRCGPRMPLVLQIDTLRCYRGGQHTDTPWRMTLPTRFPTSAVVWVSTACGAHLWPCTSGGVWGAAITDGAHHKSTLIEAHEDPAAPLHASGLSDCPSIRTQADHTHTYAVGRTTYPLLLVPRKRAVVGPQRHASAASG